MSLLSLIFLKCWCMDIILLSYIVLMALIPPPPSFLQKYNLSASLLGWKLPDIARIFLVLMSIWSISLQFQSNIPTEDVKVGTANALWATALLKSDSWEFQIFLIRFIYSFVTLSLFIGPFYEMLSSIPRYL